jgi:oxygen-independent coproporphyrinogen-3 oxidase
VYIHVPFCRTKCPYCDFYSVTGGSATGGDAGSDAGARFVDALGRELGMRAGELESPAGTVYVGGGTPSCLEDGLASSLPAIVARHVAVEEGAEVTIEVNPDDVTPDSLERYLAGGFNRISIGVQSLDDGELRMLGRRHDSAAARAAVLAAREAGFDKIGIDLIFGMEGQTVEGWRRTLDEAAGLGPEHMSCYQLTVEEHTPFGARAAAGESLAAGEELSREMFLEASETLAGAGFVHYEVSNYARGEENRSRHNTGYWLRRPYLGLGPSAHSFDGFRRRWNPGSLDAWLSSLEAGEDPVEGSEVLSAAQARAESLMLGFRTSEGVEKSLIEESPGWEEKLEELTELSLVKVDGDRVVPTPGGFLVADQLPLLFMKE